MSKKVKEQKGPIRAGERTSKIKTHREKVDEAYDEAALRRSGQTLTLHEPKTSRR